MPDVADYNDVGKDFWLRLDNAAKIYPAVRSNELTSVIRISVELKERIKAKQFREAINAIENRFPYYQVKLRAGFFWYYLEYTDLPVQVVADRGIPCRAFGNDELMYRILVRENKVSVEFSHILTDGTGAFEFLKTLLFTYFTKCGYGIPDDTHWYRPGKHHIRRNTKMLLSGILKKQMLLLSVLPRHFMFRFLYGQGRASMYCLVLYLSVKLSRKLKNMR